jgi:CheY-like chemotaxis protein
LINANRFDVLLCDIGLPDGSGYTLVAEAKQKQSKLKAIAISGSFNSATDVEFGRISGFDSYLTKPWDSNLLRTALPKVRLGWGGQQAARRKSAKKS